MTGYLAKNSYGKSCVRLTKVTRRPDRHELIELSLDIALEGEFSQTYLTGDNSAVIATDTMRNTVYALAAEHPVDSPENFCLALTSHFLQRNRHVYSAMVTATATPWQRITTATGPHKHSFHGGSTERRTCHVVQTREACVVQAGLKGLGLLKTTDSAFKGFIRDEFTTLPETDDRIFATFLEAEWTYAPGTIDSDWNSWFEKIRTAAIAVFADHYSLSVQQTLYEMGIKALEACPQITSIDLAMPNQHRIPVNLAPLGKENRNEVFVTTSEPYGYITATVARKDS